MCKLRLSLVLLEYIFFILLFRSSAPNITRVATQACVVNLSIKYCTQDIIDCLGQYLTNELVPQAQLSLGKCLVLVQSNLFPIMLLLRIITVLSINKYCTYQMRSHYTVIRTGIIFSSVRCSNFQRLYKLIQLINIAVPRITSNLSSVWVHVCAY